MCGAFWKSRKKSPAPSDLSLMPMFRLDRAKQAGPLLEWKVRIFAIAGVIALGGMFFGARWMTGVALGLLVGVMVLGFALGRKEPTDAEADDGADEAGDHFNA